VLLQKEGSFPARIILWVNYFLFALSVLFVENYVSVYVFLKVNAEILVHPSLVMTAFSARNTLTHSSACSSTFAYISFMPLSLRLFLLRLNIYVLGN